MQSTRLYFHDTLCLKKSEAKGGIPGSETGRIGLVRTYRVAFLGLIGLLAAAGCTPLPVISPPLELNATATNPLPTITPRPSQPSQPSATVPATTTPVAQARICSPLDGYTLDQLVGQVSNPYNPPPPGSDDPHYGTDLADFRPEDRIARSGMAVQAVLEGRIAGVTLNRFPYGNLVIIETRLDALSAGQQAQLFLPDLPAEPRRPLALSCPDYTLPPDWRTSPRSLYLLYAHLLRPPTLQTGDTITCGEQIGQIGDSGNALAPHLHLEVRIGPAGVNFPAMAHYDTSARLEEMGAYCLWRVSGLFESIDPFCLLTGCPPSP